MARTTDRPSPDPSGSVLFFLKANDGAYEANVLFSKLSYRF